MWRWPPGSPDSLFAQVVDTIAIAVISGKVGEGAIIPNEGGLGISVSRSVYREALKYLSAKGLIEARPRSGTRAAAASHWNLLDPDVLRWSLAARPDEKFIRDLYELRSFIEPNAARLAALRRTDAQALAIRKAYEGMAAVEPYSEFNIQSDVLFHECIIDASGNPAMRCLKSVVTTTMMWSMQLQLGRTREDYLSALSDHRRVAEAIEQQEAERAYSVMSALVQDALADTLNMFRRRRAVKPFKEAAE